MKDSTDNKPQGAVACGGKQGGFKKKNSK